MADLDSNLPLKRIGTTALAITGGASSSPVSVSGTFDGNISFTITGRGVVNVMSQGRHKDKPVIVETTDGVTSLEIEGKITSFKGASNTHMYEVLTRSGTAAAAQTTADGDAQCYEIVITFIQSKQATPALQTMTFKYCHVDSLEITASTEDTVTFKASITNFQNYPVAA